jgi:hypothetical protein
LLVILVDGLVLASLAMAAGQLLSSNNWRRRLEQGSGTAMIGAGVALAVR